MSGTVNPNTLHSPPVCNMFEESTILKIIHVFPRCHDNDVGVIMMMSSSKFCGISWRGRLKSWLRPWALLYYLEMERMCLSLSPGTWHWRTGSSVKLITLCKNAPGKSLTCCFHFYSVIAMFDTASCILWWLW